MKRFLSALLAVSILAVPSAAFAGEALTLSGSSAKVAPGSGPIIDVGNLRQAFVLVSVTAGSGTVNPFRVWVEGSIDGTIFAEIACDLVLKAGAAAPGAAATVPQRDIVNETAVVTSAIYSATCSTSARHIRARWDVTGTTPSETFSVVAFVK